MVRLLVALLLVVDSVGSRVELLAPSEHVLGSIGRLGSGDDELRRPRGTTLDGPIEPTTASRYLSSPAAA
jgi:hypothetical protein